MPSIAARKARPVEIRCGQAAPARYLGHMLRAIRGRGGAFAAYDGERDMPTEAVKQERMYGVPTVPPTVPASGLNCFLEVRDPATKGCN